MSTAEHPSRKERLIRAQANLKRFQKKYGTTKKATYQSYPTVGKWRDTNSILQSTGPVDSTLRQE